MKIVIDIPEDVKKAFDNATKDDLYGCYYDANSVIGNAIKNGTPLPEGAEILTKEAYSDLCLRASQERKTGKWISAYPDIEPNPMFAFGICSICGFRQSLWHELNYCPDCGAKMEGAEE